MRYELTATKNDATVTTYHRTRQAAEDAAHEARTWGWATIIKRI